MAVSPVSTRLKLGRNVVDQSFSGRDTATRQIAHLDHSPLGHADGSVHVVCSVLEHTVCVDGSRNVTEAVVGVDDHVVALSRVQGKRAALSVGPSRVLTAMNR